MPPLVFRLFTTISGQSATPASDRINGPRISCSSDQTESPLGFSCSLSLVLAISQTCCVERVNISRHWPNAPQMSSKPFPVVLFQYKRDDYGVDCEECLHWALFILTDLTLLKGHAFHAVDYKYAAPRANQWNHWYKEDVSLFSSNKGLGGVQVGDVPAQLLDKVVEHIKIFPIPKHEEWNCRSDLKRSLNEDDFLADLRQASVKTVEVTEQMGQLVPHIVWEQERDVHKPASERMSKRPPVPRPIKQETQEINQLMPSAHDR
ncbi:hypothetical protein HETIRDRAFT_102092 [Heterobasidion irregulare TC 32-1]|uniref:Uncharacterized protein n=1 Tax=Heterobasidion irregulare (strain TC 32-1) TaxID=747525 RepID=W4K7I8_HETIT|nr:uncharacterized protein HETIRDRAFT_102092 [Heterobasidion irregulare TC 32-1]ETW81036.1 hypothetical protein HETIRDRAFT_102092 [Heterobasidion irregulare TC 32-1]